MHPRALILILIIAGSMAIGSTLLLNQSLKSNKAQDPTPPLSNSIINPDNITVKLKMQPEETELKVGQDSKLNVWLEVPDVMITGFHGVLNYNPNKIKIVDIQAGSFFNSPTILEKTVDPQTGQMIFALGVLNQNNGSNQGYVMTIYIKALSQGKFNENLVAFNRNLSKIGIVSLDKTKIYSSNEQTLIFEEAPFTITP